MPCDLDTAGSRQRLDRLLRRMIQYHTGRRSYPYQTVRKKAGTKSDCPYTIGRIPLCWRASLVIPRQEAGSLCSPAPKGSPWRTWSRLVSSWRLRWAKDVGLSAAKKRFLAVGLQPRRSYLRQNETSVHICFLWLDTQGGGSHIGIAFDQESQSRLSWRRSRPGEYTWSPDKSPDNATKSSGISREV